MTFLPVCVYAGIQDQFFDDDSAEPWHISSDEINYNNKANQYIAKGNVIITKKGRNLTADFVRFNYNTMEILAVGHVIMTAGEDVLIGARMEMNLETEIGTIYNGTIFLKENHFYIKGNKIKKLGENSYFVDKATLTTCDGENPAWKVTGRNLKVTLEGYGFVNHAALWVKKMPLFYTPFFVFPVKQKRQSGLLPPQIGYSKRKWEEYNQPFYWAINESSDATFYLYHMGRRGNKVAFEYRYVLGDASKGTMMYDFLKDRKVDDGIHSFDETGISSKEWGYTGDDELRPNADRYWFRWKHDQSMPFGFSAKLDIDIISDHDYLHEFKNGYTGFQETSDYYYNNFGRDIDEHDDFTRVNSLSINKSWSQYSLNAELQWYDNVINRRQNDIDTTLQKLSLIEFDALKQKILQTPFYIDFDSEYTYFYSKDGNKLHNMDLYTRFYFPCKFGNYFNFEPSFGTRETIWFVDDDPEGTIEVHNILNRQIYDIKLDLATEIHKIYNINGKNLDRIKHSIEPQIVYGYTPEQNQEEYPDSIAKNNLITYSITNTFTSRSKENAKQKNSVVDEKKDDPISYNYNQFCRFFLEQSYDIDKARDDNSEPFSSIYAEFEFSPAKYLSLQGDAKWCQYEDSFLSRNVAVTLSNYQGDRLFVEYRHNAFESSESIYYNINLMLLDNLEVFSEYERNIYDGRDIKTSIGCLYKSQCWSIKCSYEDEEDDRRYGVIVNLYGLGEIGTNALLH